MLRYEIKGQSFNLLPEKAIYWKEQETVLIADLHLGKASHFRKAGIAVPHKAEVNNIMKLGKVIREWNPRSVVFLGDLFHSYHNRMWEEFGKFLEMHNGIDYQLVLGNHDIMTEEEYDKFNIKLLQEPVTFEPFTISHYPLEEVSEQEYNLAGHIHPSVRMFGRANQSLRLPCFYFTENQGVLPAFGSFTGMFKMNPKKGDRVFVIADDEVLEVSI